MARFVLLHGGWHGGWCFRWLARELEHLGHDVAAPDLRCEEIGLTPLDHAREVGPQPDAIVVGLARCGYDCGAAVSRLLARSPTGPSPQLRRQARLDSGHSPFLTQPAELASILSSLG
jgi:hypothetical protein